MRRSGFLPKAITERNNSKGLRQGSNQDSKLFQLRQEKTPNKSAKTKYKQGHTFALLDWPASGEFAIASDVACEGSGCVLVVVDICGTGTEGQDTVDTVLR